MCIQKWIWEYILWNSTVCLFLSFLFISMMNLRKKMPLCRSQFWSHSNFCKNFKLDLYFNFWITFNRKNLPLLNAIEQMCLRDLFCELQTKMWDQFFVYTLWTRFEVSLSLQSQISIAYEIFDKINLWHPASKLAKI